MGKQAQKSMREIYAADVAKMLKVANATVRKMTQRKQLVPVRTDGQYNVFDHAAVVELKASRQQKRRGKR